MSLRPRVQAPPGAFSSISYELDEIKNIIILLQIIIIKYTDATVIIHTRKE